jgi:hypothetical protein
MSLQSTVGQLDAFLLKYTCTASANLPCLVEYSLFVLRWQEKEQKKVILNKMHEKQ